VRAGLAWEIARRWAETEAGTIPGLQGVYLAGSINWLPEDAELPATSDIDVMVVLEGPKPPLKPGKFRYQGALLEVSYQSADMFGSAEQLLANFQLSPGFRAGNLLLDPTGRLAALQQTVSVAFAQRSWVIRRCEHTRDNLRGMLAYSARADTLHEQATGWLFGTSGPTQLMLVAGLRNPTVRKRYLATRELLAEYGRLDIYEQLLEQLGCARMTPTRVSEHVASLAAVFDAASAVARTPYIFLSDISQVARPIPIDGSRELIAQGYHREAVFWIVATYARCLNILHHDAPADVQEQFTVGFRSLLADLGIESPADFQRRSAAIRDSLPRLWDVAMGIIAATPEVQD
jgi:hypothetical protein